jgi:hypothetical protein
VTAWNLPPYFGIVGVSCGNCFNTRGLLGIRLLTMRRRLVWLLLGVSLLPVPTLSTAEEACDETLDLLGSDPNNERVKGRSNYVYLLCFW